MGSPFLAYLSIKSSSVEYIAQAPLWPTLLRNSHSFSNGTVFQTSANWRSSQVGATKPDRKTRRPEWNQNFLIRSDLPDPNVDKDSGSEEEEGEYDAYGRGAYRSRNRGDDACVFSTIDVTDASGGKNLGGKVGKEGGPWAGRPCGSCRACRRRKIEVVLEIWNSNTQKVNEDIQERSNGHSNSSSSSSNIDASGKPDDLFGEAMSYIHFDSTRAYKHS